MSAISDRTAAQLMHGRVGAHPELDPLADLLAAYRSAAAAAVPHPSETLSTRLDLSRGPIAIQRDAGAGSH